MIVGPLSSLRPLFSSSPVDSLVFSTPFEGSLSLRIEINGVNKFFSLFLRAEIDVKYGRKSVPREIVLTKFFSTGLRLLLGFFVSKLLALHSN